MRAYGLAALSLVLVTWFYGAPPAEAVLSTVLLMWPVGWVLGRLA